MWFFLVVIVLFFLYGQGPPGSTRNDTLCPYATLFRADFDTDGGADGVDGRFTGRLTLARLGDLPARLDALGPIRALDLSDIERIDTVGAWIVTRTAHAHDAEVIGASEDAQRLLKALADDKSDYRVHRRSEEHTSDSSH